MTGLSVFNLDWSGYARGGDIEKAATKVTSAIDKGTDKTSSSIEKTVGKISTDLQRSTDRLVGVIKDGTKDMSDTIKRTTTNAATSTPAALAISTGLHSVAESANRIADTIAARPNELEVLADSAKGLNRKFSDLVDTASQYAESANKLRTAATETVKASDWIAGNYSIGDVSVHNAAGFVADISVFNFR
jgi:uncharacterized phage infection (PIP) family protein YhgE